MIDFNNAPLQQDESQLRHAHSYEVSAEDIRERLNADVASFLRWLYCGRAFIKRSEARIGDISGQAGTSLAIELSGKEVGQWFDHATEQGGDLIALYRGYMGYAGTTAHFRQSLKEIAREFLHDPIEPDARVLWRSTPTLSPTEKILADSVRFGTCPRTENEVLGPPVATYKYLDVDGNILTGVTRYEPKSFRPWCFKVIDGEKKWVIGSPPVRPLYHLPELTNASEVVLVEGEGKADALARFNVVTTTIMGGAHAVDKTNWLPLAKKKIYIWPDNDDAGEKFAKAATAKLINIGCRIWIVPIPGGKPPKWDCGNCIGDGEDPLAVLATAIELLTDPNQLILTAGQFVAGFTSPEYLIDGIVQQSYLYSLTARTNHGKTAVAMYAGSTVARGLAFHGRETRQGSVLFLAGENSQDIRARFLVLAEHDKFDADRVPLYFIDGVINIAASLARIRDEAAKIPNLVLVIVDTAAAYYSGQDSNDNTQQGEFARLLRELIKLPGRPAVIVNCHPVKNASHDNLLPLGGSAFVNEVDGNLTLWSETDKQTSLHWQGKFRGPEFEAMAFDLRTVSCDRVRDSKGRRMPSVVAVPITEDGAERKEKVAEEEEKTVLRLIHVDKQASFTSMARAAGFVLPDGTPSKAKVQRVVERLKADKLVFKHRGSKYRLTKKGCREIKVKWDDDEDE
jgi:hypothetical protein